MGEQFKTKTDELLWYIRTHGPVGILSIDLRFTSTHGKGAHRRLLRTLMDKGVIRQRSDMKYYAVDQPPVGAGRCKDYGAAAEQVVRMTRGW